MCEICLQFRCPVACPCYETVRGTPSGRAWEFREKAWSFWENALDERNTEIRTNEKEEKKEEGKG